MYVPPVRLAFGANFYSLKIWFSMLIMLNVLSAIWILQIFLAQACFRLQGTSCPFPSAFCCSLSPIAFIMACFLILSSMQSAHSEELSEPDFTWINIYKLCVGNGAEIDCTDEPDVQKISLVLGCDMTYWTKQRSCISERGEPSTKLYCYSSIGLHL